MKIKTVSRKRTTLTIATLPTPTIPAATNLILMVPLTQPHRITINS